MELFLRRINKTYLPYLLFLGIGKGGKGDISNSSVL